MLSEDAMLKIDIQKRTLHFKRPAKTSRGEYLTRLSRFVTIERNGSVPKFVQTVRSISFSARNAIKNGQKVLYITERCVFILTARGLKLLEVYPGIDMQKDILDLLPFDVELPDSYHI